MLTANPSGKEIKEIKEHFQEMSKEVVQDISRWFSRMLSAGNPRNLQGFSVAADGLLQATLLAGKGHNL